VSLLLAAMTLWSGERAGRTGDDRFVALTAYLFALAAPLHVTALVAAPAAILLACTTPDLVIRWRSLATLGSALLVAGAVGTGRWWLAVLAAVGLLACVAVRPRVRALSTAPIAMAVALTAFAVMLLRARHDPGINQGNPATLAALASVISREQYEVAGLLPRQAPVWLQVTNFLQYMDWQIALGVGSTVVPTIPRMVATIAYLVLGAFGFDAHRRLDPRTWRALVTLGLCGSLGVVAYLNLKAGASIGYGILPDDAPHEPRERDYFFVLAFWTWGLWAGIGAVSVATRWFRLPRRFALGAGVAIAALPAALNLTSVNRRAGPEARLPELFARELLDATPPNAVLFVAGDNDTYPLWYLQQAMNVRRDVVVVTYPLIGAAWFRDELHRRYGLGFPPPHDRWRGLGEELRGIAASAREAGRPVAVAVTVERVIREHVMPHSVLRGLVYSDLPPRSETAPRGTYMGADLPRLDAGDAKPAAERLRGPLALAIRPSIDPTARLMQAALQCPSLVVRATADSSALRLLDSTCNYR
jgi:hypothetical protein